MPVTWLIEADVFPKTEKSVTSALDRLGVPWRHFDSVRGGSLPPASEPVLFWGSLGAAYVDRIAARWTPGAVGDERRFFCSTYYSQLRSLLANGDGLFTSVESLVANPGEVLRRLGNPQRFFVRPDSPLKPFSGRVLDAADVTLKALDFGYYYDDASLPVVVSTARQVSREWRFCVADGRMIAGCEYVAGRSGTAGEVPAAAAELASSVAALEWQAAPLYFADIGLVDGELRVMELNPFSGADFYACDSSAIVEAATAVALRLAGDGTHRANRPSP